MCANERALPPSGNLIIVAKSEGIEGNVTRGLDGSSVGDMLGEGDEIITTKNEVRCGR